jgi:hypothetical protein
MIININNPFEHFYPEDLDSKDVHRLFVKEYTEHNYLTARKHTIVEGSRGSGKSMLFKFLEPACQAIEWGEWDAFLKSKPNAFIGVYVNCNTGDYRKSEFEELLASEYVPKILGEKIVVHDFLMRIAECTIKTISDQLSGKLKEDEKTFNEIILALDGRGLYKEPTQYPRTLAGLSTIFSNERKIIRESLRDFFDGYALPNNKLNYTGNLAEPSFTQGSFLYVFFTKLRALMGAEDIPFFLLFDEAGELMLLPLQQRVINTLITQRIPSLVCVKVSARPESYNTDVDLYNKPIQHIHDYDIINLDSLYTNNRESYYRRMIEISNKRLRLAGFEVTDIQKFLPTRESEIEKMKEAEEFTGQEYDNLPPDKKIEERQNYIYKYARARFFQRFFHKTGYWYTGFDNLVNFSAGITRSFLDPCFEMVERYMQKNPGVDMKKIEHIPPEIQWETIRDFSNDFIDKELLERIRRRASDSDERKMLQHLFTLLESFGQAFKLRLQNPNSRYPRIISFSIRETLPRDPELDAVLRRALQDCFLQKRWYRGKSGYEMLECYILNRKNRVASGDSQTGHGRFVWFRVLVQI